MCVYVYECECEYVLYKYNPITILPDMLCNQCP